MNSLNSPKPTVAVVDTGLPERSEAPVAHLIVHPGEDFVMTSLKDLVVGDVQIIPVCRVHRLVKRLSSLMALKGDPFTAWRQFAPIWHTIQDREVNLDTLPKWLIYAAEQT